MKARLRFLHKPFFNFPPDQLLCPGILVGRAEGRRMWTMLFTVTKQVNVQVYEGELRWLVGPIEQDFGKGVRFQLISNPSERLRPQPVEAESSEEEDEDPGHSGDDHGSPDDKGKGKAKGAGAPADPPTPPTPPPKPEKPPQSNRKHPKMPHLPKDAYTRTPAAGVLAEGELLG